MDPPFPGGAAAAPAPSSSARARSVEASERQSLNRAAHAPHYDSEEDEDEDHGGTSEDGMGSGGEGAHAGDRAGAAAAAGSESFHFSQLTVEALRNELRARGLNTVGLKSVLVQRLVDATGSAETPQLMCKDDTPRRRTVLRKMPSRDEFATEEEYQLEWTRWREARDTNNESVKRSRSSQKKNEKTFDQLLQQRKEECDALAALLSQLQDEAKFLRKILSSPDPHNLEPVERDRLMSVLTMAATMPQHPTVAAAAPANP
eukprot:m.20840 g.20840  ORF g.20840 m.20840 type:complete len:260 (+) comp3566_c0_seq1:119-898(+)